MQIEMTVLADATSQIALLFIRDNSVTTGEGLTGLTDASAGLTASFKRDIEAAPGAITLVAATVGTYLDSGFVEIDAVNMPGCYEFHVPDAALAAGANRVQVLLFGAADMEPAVLNIELTTQPVVSLDLTQTFPAINTAGTLGDALNAARAQAFGRWTISGTPGQPGATLTLLGADDATIVRTFDMSTLGARS